MKVLSIDPGITTGYAVVGDSGIIVYSGWLRMVDPGKDDYIRYLCTVALDYDTDEVCIERGPDHERNANEMLSKQDALLDAAFPNATWMTPNEWKPTPRGKSAIGTGYTIHERDAIRMGREFMHRQKRLIGAVA